MLAILGCNKLVNVPGNAGAQLVTSQVFMDSADAVSGVVGLYGDASMTNRYIDRCTGLSSDELMATSGAGSVQLSNTNFYTEQPTAGSSTATGDASTLWAPLYGSTGIFHANAALEAIKAAADSGLSMSLRNQLTGECKLVRAFQYFYLVNLFGPVPLVLSTDWRSTALYGRAPVDSVYNQIERDLLDAQSKLVSTYPSAGHQRPNRYTATALLARVYLYQKKWDLAKAMADTVINSGLYSLVSNLDNVFLDKSNEAIWQLGPNSTSVPLDAPGYSLFGAAAYSTYFGPSYWLSPSLVNAFELGDKRLAHWTTIDTIFSFGSGGNQYLPMYYKTKNYSTIIRTGAEDLMVVRLAEIYLIRAEALAQQGDLAGSMADVNVIRARAGLGAITAVDLNDALGKILHERQVELFCEWGHRWLDLKRMDSVDAVMTRVKPQYWPADGHTALYPIPYPELVSNQYLTQNLGY
jgi:hypothetical protein